MDRYFKLLKFEPGKPLALDAPLVASYPDAAFYKPARGLEEAFVSAMLLGMPLLLTGEPGTGKTRAAYWLADKFQARLLRHDVKSETSGRDLLYRFDEVARFRDANARKERPLIDYVTFSALGEAIVRGIGGAAPLAPLRRARGGAEEAFGLAELPPMRALLADGPSEPEHCVVLIDELDKAPRDTPNDLLAEFDSFAFDIPELGVRIARKDAASQAQAADRVHRPIVIITSNSERSLPPPFLRRCLFFDIPPPTLAEMEEIVAATLANRNLGSGTALFADAWAFYQALRDAPEIDKKPSTVELLAWLDCLIAQAGCTADRSLRGREGEARLLETLVVMAKTREDREIAQALFTSGAWLPPRGG